MWGGEPWPLQGGQLGRAPPPTIPLPQEHRSGGCSRAFRSWCTQAAFSLRTREPVRCPQPGRVSVCLQVQMHTLSHVQYAPIYTYIFHRPGCGMGKGTQTPFSLDKFQTQMAHFYFISEKKENIPFRQKGRWTGPLARQLRAAQAPCAVGPSQPPPRSPQSGSSP